MFMIHRHIAYQNFQYLYSCQEKTNKSLLGGGGSLQSFKSNLSFGNSNKMTDAIKKEIRDFVYIS